MNVVVTGASGLTASAVVDRLARSGHRVLALIRREADVPGAAEVTIGDCRDVIVTGPLLRQADVLVHVAGIRYGPDLAKMEALRIPGSVIVVSSAGVYSRHRASAATYRAGEDAIARVRADATFVRPTMIYGSSRDLNVHHLVRFAARWGFLPLIGTSGRSVQPIHFADLTEALTALVERPAPGERVDAGGGAALTVRDMFAAILEAVGHPVRLLEIPAGVGLATARLFDLVRGSHWAERVERLAEDRGVDNTALVRLTGIRPREFPEGVRDQVRAMNATATTRA